MIAHVAVRRGGTTYSLPAPNRHHHVLWTMPELTEEEERTAVQGFLDDTGKFLTRRQAYRAVVGTPQFKRRLNSSSYDGPELFSEDLW